jgi:hypothetical protein
MSSESRNPCFATSASVVEPAVSDPLATSIGVAESATAEDDEDEAEADDDTTDADAEADDEEGAVVEGDVPRSLCQIACLIIWSGARYSNTTVMRLCMASSRSSA